eukprot:s474_g11.t2
MGPANEPALALAEGDATLQFLLNADAGTRISFLSFLFATKSISWALAVLLAARLRHSYVPIIYGAGPVATAIDTARRRFPRVAMGAERAAQRAAASRSARLLAGLAGAEPLHLAPAVVEVPDPMLADASMLAWDQHPNRRLCPDRCQVPLQGGRCHRFAEQRHRTQRPARLEQKIAALPSPLAVAKCACVRQLLEAARAGAMEAAIRRLLESTFGEFVEGMDRASASSFPMTLQDLNLKEKAIQEELDEDGNFPFDLTSGRIGQVTVSPGWMGNVEVVATGIVLNFTFSPMKAMNNAFRKDDPDEEEEQYMGVF